MNWLCLPTDFNYTTEQLGDLTKEALPTSCTSAAWTS